MTEQQIQAAACPFCGFPTCHAVFNPTNGLRVICLKCDAEGPAAKDVQEANDKWNSRAADAKDARIAELEGRVLATAVHAASPLLDELATVRADNARLRVALGRCMDLLCVDPTEHCATGCDWCQAWNDRRVASLSDPDGKAALEEWTRLDVANGHLADMVKELTAEVGRLKAAGEGR